MIDSSIKVELKRFLQTALVYEQETGKTANMPSCIVDTCWHEELKSPESWNQFTKDAVGGEVLHLENRGYGLIEWVPFYENMFGKLSLDWFLSPDGSRFDQQAYDDYCLTGELKMAWDCVPNIKQDVTNIPTKPLIPGMGSAIAV